MLLRSNISAISSGLHSTELIHFRILLKPVVARALPDSWMEIRIPIYIAKTLRRSISLVHMRAFSFTDDSAVVTRARQKVTAPDINRGFLCDPDPALYLKNLRLIESDAYQKLFQSSRRVLEEPWPIISHAVEDMHKLSSELPGQIKVPIKKLLRCEALYSSILILSPPDLENDITDYGKFLIFEYAIEYANLMSSVGNDAEEFAFFTSLDMLRASFIVKRLLALFISDFALFFDGSVSRPPLQVQTASGAPTIQRRTVGEMLSQALNCLTLCDNILQYLGLRFGYPDPLKEYRVQSSDVQRSLRASYEKWTRRPPTTSHDHYTTGPALDQRFSWTES